MRSKLVAILGFLHFVRQNYTVRCKCSPKVIINYSDPRFDSWYSIAIKISRNTELIVIRDFRFYVSITNVIGSSSEISTSKIKNITAIKRIVANFCIFLYSL